MKTLRAALLSLGLIALALSESKAQPPPGLSFAEAQRLEQAVERNPNDTAARSRLLDHYYLDKSVDPKDAIAARRRHILWLIENAPESDLAGTSQATIDRAGYYLADAEGYKLASQAWRAQMEKPDTKSAALVNGAFFFKTEDRDYCVHLLQRALTLDPKNKEIGARLGDEYALIILGLTLENRNHYPLRADGALTQSAFAKSARAALSASQNPYVLAKAGYMLAWQGAILRASGKLPFDPLPLAQSTVERAVSLAPGEQDVAAVRDNVLDFERMAGKAAPRTQEPLKQPQDDATNPPAAPAAGIDLKQISVGMSRKDVLRLGPPSGRITMDEDGHLVEIFQYNFNASPSGRVRLTDGVVSSIQQ